MNYLDKLKDPRWQKKRLEVFQRDGFTCKKCGFDRHTLAVHHIRYNGQPWESDIRDLDTLCIHCHFVIEFNKKHHKFDYQDFKIDKFIKDPMDSPKFCMVYSFGDYFCIDTIDNDCNLLYRIAVSGNNVKNAIKKHLRNG